MSYRHISAWPPNRVWVDRKKSKLHPHGEVGVLQGVAISQRGELNMCFLSIDYEEGTYMGCLLIDDYPFCQQVSKLLEQHCGRPIQEIGTCVLIFPNATNNFKSSSDVRDATSASFICLLVVADQSEVS